MNQSYDLCIIGAGASGLAAANRADPRLRMVIIDKNKIPGRKIYATGGGRCNLTNRACERHKTTLDFFHGLGLETFMDDEGRYYPYSQRAADVVKVLTDGLRNRDADWIFETEVTEIIRRDDGCFDVVFKGNAKDGKKSDEERTLKASAVLLCPGGKAAPSFGTTGDGYILSRKLGHTVTRTYPVLTGIECTIPEDCEGIRAKGEVVLLEDGVETAREKGEIQFTSKGISGICVFDLTGHIKAREGEAPKDAMKRFRLSMDLAPDFSQEEVMARDSSFGIVTDALAGWIPKEELKAKIVEVKNVWGWDKAQCTAGGIALNEINEETMESAICPGLYFAGEILDIQGPCGGYNLQNAWETGIKAAKAISDRMSDGRGGR